MCAGDVRGGVYGDGDSDGPDGGDLPETHLGAGHDGSGDYAGAKEDEEEGTCRLGNAGPQEG